MKIEEKLHKEIHSELDELNRLEVGSEQYKTTVDGVSKLMDKAIEIERLNIEHEEKVKTQEIETEMKQKQLENDRKNNRNRDILTAAGIVIPAICYGVGTVISINFEREGTFTTAAGRASLNKFLNLFKK